MEVGQRWGMMGGLDKGHVVGSGGQGQLKAWALRPVESIPCCGFIRNTDLIRQAWHTINICGTGTLLMDMPLARTQ